MRYEKCEECNEIWNVSVKYKGKTFRCPDCREKAKKRAKKYGNTPKVLLKNKNKFMKG